MSWFLCAAILERQRCYAHLRRDLFDCVVGNGEHEGLQSAFLMLGEYTEEFPEVAQVTLKLECPEVHGNVSRDWGKGSAIGSDGEGG